MHESDNSNKSIIPQSNTYSSDDLIIKVDRYDSKEKQVIADFIALLLQPESPKTDALIVHFWLTLRDRLTDAQYNRVCQAFDITGGAL